MAKDTPTIVLISGANRGLGRGLLEEYLAQPNHIVIAANRDPEAASSMSLQNLEAGSGSRVIIVRVDASNYNDPFTAVAELEKQGIDHLDIVIANAGISQVFPAVKDLEIDDLERHMVANVYGVVKLYQATRELLTKSEKPLWVTMGSAAGFLENQLTLPNAAYAPTKTTVHWMTKRIDGEEEKVGAFVMDPGWVQTDMGNNGAKALGFEQAPVSLEESVSGMKRVFDVATKETHGGRMWGYDGKQEAW